MYQSHSGLFGFLLRPCSPHHIQSTVSEIPNDILYPCKSLSLSKSLPPVLFPAPSSLQLRDFEGCGAGKVQEEGSFLFGEEGGGNDVVDACWDVFGFHVAEAASVISTALLLEGSRSRIPDIRHRHHLKTDTVLPGSSQFDEQGS